MKVHVRWTIIDRLSKKEDVQILEAFGEKEADTLRYERYVVHFAPDQMELQMQGDFGSHIYLYRDRMGVAFIKSPYGKMVLKTVLQGWRQDKDEWMTAYRLLDEQGHILSDRQLFWHMTPVKKTMSK